MTSRGPVITLAAVGLLGLLLFITNQVQAPGSPSTAAESGIAAAESGTPAVEPGAPAVEPGAPDAAAEPAEVPESFPPQASYTGETEGIETGEAAVAVTVNGDEAAAYVCDGRAIEAWYKGVAKDGEVQLEDKSGNALTGTLDGDTITGTLSAQGKSLTFTAEQAKKPAGLYRTSARGVTTGWIQQSDGSVTGLRSDGQPAGPLDPTTAQRVEGSF